MATLDDLSTVVDELKKVADTVTVTPPPPPPVDDSATIQGLIDEVNAVIAELSNVATPAPAPVDPPTPAPSGNPPSAPSNTI